MAASVLENTNCSDGKGQKHFAGNVKLDFEQCSRPPDDLNTSKKVDSAS